MRGKAKNKKTAPKRTRRSPDDRCLEHSENRLEHALAEQLMHATALSQLEAEIPRLRAIIAALKPDQFAPHQAIPHKQYGFEIGAPRNGPVGPAVTDQAAFLARFIKPVEGNVMRAQAPVVLDETSDEPFLPAAPGEELLP